MRTFVVTGGAGFLGSHLCEAIVFRGDRVVCIDNLSSGSVANIAGLIDHPQFSFIEADVSQSISYDGHVDAVAHLASPASPPDYHRWPLETLAVGSRGTENGLMLAAKHGARFVMASTSEVYGDPLVHPQIEEYWGNVNPIGPRSVYDESKRFAEAITSAYRRTLNVNTGIVRIFNTYGPRMRPRDGRVVSSFIAQALIDEPITIYGDGLQTRSFCYVDDLVRGLVLMLDGSEEGPINLGNPDEYTISEFAHLIVEMTGSASRVEHHPLPADDPTQRKPDIGRARARLGWEPSIPTHEGIERTIAWFRGHLEDVKDAALDLRGPQPDGTSIADVIALAGRAS
jgi:dTDP-glucose 4,6-dehydratase